MMTWFSEKMFIYTRCICGFMPNLHKKSWILSNLYKVFYKMSIITIKSVFFSALLDLILRETAFCVDTKIVTAFLPGFHETVLHDEAVIEPFKASFWLFELLYSIVFPPNWGCCWNRKNKINVKPSFCCFKPNWDKIALMFTLGKLK